MFRFFIRLTATFLVITGLSAASMLTPTTAPSVAAPLAQEIEAAAEAALAKKIIAAKANCEIPKVLPKVLNVDDFHYLVPMTAREVIADMALDHARPLTCGELRLFASVKLKEKVKMPYIGLDIGAKPTRPSLMDLTVFAVVVPDGDGNAIDFVRGGGAWQAGVHFLGTRD